MGSGDSSISGRETGSTNFGGSTVVTSFSIEKVAGFSIRRRRSFRSSKSYVVVDETFKSVALASLYSGLDVCRCAAPFGEPYCLGKVIPVTIFGDLYHAGANIRIDECVEKLVGATQRKVREVCVLVCCALVLSYNSLCIVAVARTL